MKYNYDIAISFAEEDRQTALSIVSALESHGLKVYYYPERPSEVIGKELDTVLWRIYQYESALAIVLFSAHYVQKKWTRHELKAIQERRKYYSDYLVPVKVDDTALKEIDDLIEQVGYHQWNGDVRPLLKFIGVKKKEGQKTAKRLQGAVNVVMKARTVRGGMTGIKF